MFSIELRNAFQNNKYTFLTTAALLLLPVYSWKSFFSFWKKLKQEHENRILFQKRHNCLVTYQANKGFVGWPPNLGRVKVRTDKLFEDLYEPILYFIGTAEKSLDIAIMMISVKVIYSELINATRRGVEIRILFNFHHTEGYRIDIKALMALGVKCQFFIASNSTQDSIMHNKYMIKDFSKDDGYVCTGSMNFTSTSVLNNYESFVFTSNFNVVEAFENNFEECWQNVIMDNEGLINRTILMDAQLDS